VEITAGPRAGEVVEDEHASAFWTVDAWRKTVAASPFTEVACYDDMAEADLERGGSLLWHELVVP